ncbi:MAG: histidine triad nucleotide-binding protein [bacterium]
MMDCIFCKNVKKEIPVEFLYEDDLVAAFRDIRPIAPVHILVVPKEHIGSVAELKDSDEKLAGRLILTAKNLAQKEGIAENGYKILFRVGRHGGQEVPHIHLHLIGGAKLSENIRPI